MYNPEGQLDSFESKKDLEKLQEMFTPEQRARRPGFEVGEALMIKGAPFRIESMGEKLMTLRPLPWNSPEHEKLKEQNKKILNQIEQLKHGN